jgi:hypothetical protein
MHVSIATPWVCSIRDRTEAMVKYLSAELNRIRIATDVMNFDMNQK